MGRILVWAYLGTSIALVVAVALAMAEMLSFGITLGLRGVLDPPGVLAFQRWDLTALVVFAIYFFMFVPLAALGVLINGALHKQHSRVEARPNGAASPPSAHATVAVLTAYNDEESIGLAVDDFRRVPCIQQVIVVDNNSRDRTAEVARARGAIVVPETRQGYGYACMGGLRYALEHTGAEWIVLAEGDMTFYSEDTEKLLPYLEDCDLVLGTRTTWVLTRSGSQMDWFMAWGNMFLAHLIRLRYWDPVFVGRIRLTDVGCTFRAIRREALAQLIDDLTVGGHYFSPHMILAALRKGLAVVEVPIKFRERVGVSKGAGGSRRRAIGIGFQMIGEIAFH